MLKGFQYLLFGLALVNSQIGVPLYSQQYVPVIVPTTQKPTIIGKPSASTAQLSPVGQTIGQSFNYGGGSPTQSFLSNICQTPLALSSRSKIVSNTTTKKLTPPAGAQTGILQRRPTKKDNLLTNYYDKIYVDNKTSKIVVYETSVVVEKINASLPTPSELAATPAQTPYYGVISNPSSFRNWEGVSEAVFREINAVRTKPSSYIPYLQQELSSFVDDTHFMQDGRLTTANEGRNAWVEAINFLKKQPPVRPLRRVQCLDCSASYMITDAYFNPNLGHQDASGGLPFDRTFAACNFKAGGENIAYGLRSARAIVTSFLVDDGVPDRSHRQNVFENYTQVGVASGWYLGQYQTVSVQDFLY